ncbi:MAG: hypothetical protein ACRDJ2_13760 [Actinomycetota bacterium]
MTPDQLTNSDIEALRAGFSMKVLGGVTLASLLADLNAAGFGPEDIEVSGDGKTYRLELTRVLSAEELAELRDETPDA